MKPHPAIDYANPYDQVEQARRRIGDLVDRVVGLPTAGQVDRLGAIVEEASRLLAEAARLADALPEAISPGTYSVPEVAARLSISPRHAYELIRRGDFPCRVLQLGRRTRFPAGRWSSSWPRAPRPGCGRSSRRLPAHEAASGPERSPPTTWATAPSTASAPSGRRRRPPDRVVASRDHATDQNRRPRGRGDAGRPGRLHGLDHLRPGPVQGNPLTRPGPG